MADQNPTSIATNMQDAAVALAKRVETDGDDFIVKIQRRASPAAPLEAVATLEHATAAQLLNPESWLSKLAGGSAHYFFQIVHANDVSSGRVVAMYTLPVIPGAPMPADPKVVRTSSWQGPTTITYPDPNDVMASFAARAVPKLPGTPDSTGSATPAGGKSADGGAGHSTVLVQIAQERERLAEERHRMEMDALRRERDEDRRRADERINAVMAEIRASREAPKTDVAEVLVKIAAAVTPIVGAIVPILAASRKDAADREAAREQREEALRSEMMKSMRESSEKAAQSQADQMKVLQPMIGAVAQMGQTVLQQVAMFREMTSEPPQETSVMDILKVAITAWAETAARGNGSMIPDPRLAGASSTTPPAAAPRAPASQSGDVFAGADEGNADNVTPTQMIDYLAEAISKKIDVNDLAPDIVEGLSDPNFAAALVAEGGAIAAISKRLGEAFATVPENVGYVQRLFQTVAQIAQANKVDVRPLFPPAAA